MLCSGALRTTEEEASPRNAFGIKLLELFFMFSFTGKEEQTTKYTIILCYTWIAPLKIQNFSDQNSDKTYFIGTLK